MAGTITYNADSTKFDLDYIFTTTSGGTVFSANLKDETAFDLFSDTAVVDDAIYFGVARSYPYLPQSDLYLNIGTALSAVGLTITWEYWCKINYSYIGQKVDAKYSVSGAWVEMDSLGDDASNFTTTGETAVRFPWQLYQNYNVTVNGIANVWWVRARISALTSISEGGATQTEKIQTNDGIIYPVDYEEGSPCTFQTISEYLATNFTYLEPTHMGSCLYHFSAFGLSIPHGCYFETKHDLVEFGNCYSSSSRWYLGDKCTAGEKNGPNMGENGSCFEIYGGNNAYPLTGWYGNAYGSTFNSRLDNGNCGYGFVWGEIIDCSWEGCPGTNAYGVIHNVKRRSGGTMINSSQETLDSENNQLLCLTNKWGNFYSSLPPNQKKWYNYQFQFVDDYTGIFLADYAGGSGSVWELYDCTNLPFLRNDETGTNGHPYWTYYYPYGNYTSSTYYYPDYVYFYKDSDSSFTDYTSSWQVASGTTIPVNGEVGDCLYWLAHYNASYPGEMIYFDIPAGQTTNDYEYVYEFYYDGAWRNIADWWYREDLGYAEGRLLDKTDNLTKSGFVYMINKTTTGLVTINGINDYWTRMRIVTKGTGSPAIDGIRPMQSSGVSDRSWKMFYSFTYNILDEAGLPIQGATVVVQNKNGETVVTETTDASGDTTKAYALLRDIVYDPENFEQGDITLANLTYYNDRVETTYGPFDIYISKTGYQTYHQKKDITAKVEETVTLKLFPTATYLIDINP